MSKLVKRKCEVRDIPLNVHIKHSELEESARVEDSDESFETLKVSIMASWMSGDSVSFDELFNYAELYKYIQDQQGMVVIGPLENVLDQIDTHLQSSAAAQGVKLCESCVSLLRENLVAGDIYMERERKYE